MATKVLTDFVSRTETDVPLIASQLVAEKGEYRDADDSSGRHATDGDKELSDTRRITSLEAPGDRAPADAPDIQHEESWKRAWKAMKLEDASSSEKRRFAALRSQFAAVRRLAPHAVVDALGSLDEPIAFWRDCNGAGQPQVTRVRVQVETRLARWAPNQCDGSHGEYFWNSTSTLTPSRDGNTRLFEFRNAVMLDLDHLLPGDDEGGEEVDEDVAVDGIGEVDEEKKAVRAAYRRMDSLRLLYHEMLHGQLQIDHMREAAIEWGCDSPRPDLSGRDPNHERIPGLELTFFNALVARCPRWNCEKVTVHHEDCDGTRFRIPVFESPAFPKTLHYASAPFASSNIRAGRLFEDEDEEGVALVLEGDLADETRDGVFHVYYAVTGPDGE